MPGTRRSSGGRILGVLLFLLCAACAEQNGGLRGTCNDESLAVKPAACADDIQRRLDDATRATTDLQRIRQPNAGR